MKTDYSKYASESEVLRFMIECGYKPEDQDFWFDVVEFFHFEPKLNLWIEKDGINE